MSAPLGWLAAGGAVLVGLRLFRRPLGAAARLAVRSALGLAGLWVLDLAGGAVGVQVGVNLLSALTVGLLGLPGVGLLLLLPCL